MRNSTLYTLGGPKTFRRGSRKIFSRGSNMQNWEKSVREVFISDGWSNDIELKLLHWLDTGDLSIFTAQELDEIRVFLQVDQSGAEALIVAYECRNAKYRQLFENNIKPHTYLAIKLFKNVWAEEAKARGIVGVTEEVVDKAYYTAIPELSKLLGWKELKNLVAASDDWDVRYYYLAKQTCHSGNYDIQKNRFIYNILEKSGGKIVLPPEQGQLFLDTYREEFSEIPERNARIEQQAKRTKILYNLFGHPYFITHYEILDSHLKEIYAWSAQSTVAEITRQAFSNLYRYIADSNLSWDILADTHDSYLVQCPLTEIKECSRMMQVFMNQDLVSPFDGVKFKMKSECNIGLNWAPKKKDLNELGLREMPEWSKV